jgi:hypothetical protein
MKKHLISLLVLFMLVSTSLVGFSHQTMVPLDESKTSKDLGSGYQPLASNETPGIQWSKQYGTIGQDHFRQVRKTADTGYLMVGDTKSYSPDGFYAGWLMKTDAFGNEEWNHTYSSFAVLGFDCQQTSDGGYAFCGVNNQTQYWLVKTDAQGVKQWWKSYMDGTACCFTQTSDDGYILGGNTNIVVRTDSQGNMVWEKGYLNATGTVICSVLQTTDGGFIIAGKTNCYSGSYLYGFLLKLDRNGTAEWDHKFIDLEYSLLFSNVQTPDGGYLAAGGFNGYPWVVRIDQNGNELWNKTYENIDGAVEDVVLLQDGGYAFVGNDGYDTSFILTIDADGTEQWNLTINTYLLSLQQASDGGIVTAGNDESIDTMGNGILIKVGHVPQIELLKPTNAIYLFGVKIVDFFTPIVIGKMTIEVSAMDTQYSIDRVEFLVDDVLQTSDTTAPYSWLWKTSSLSKHTLTVTAYNSVGNCSSQSIKVLKIL